MFGYLNLGNPQLIGDNEAQEAVNCRVDQGFLEFKSWAIDETINRLIRDLAGREIRIDATFPLAGNMRRKMSATNTDDKLGVPPPDIVSGWNVGVNPTLAAAAYGSQPYPAGTYDFILTLYDPATGEESAWYQFSTAIGANEVLRVNLLPDVDADANYASKTQLVWRIYRRPIGSSEFLLSEWEVDPTPGAKAWDIPATAVSSAYFVSTADADLGEANDSETNFLVDLFTGLTGSSHTTSIIAQHNGKFFFRQNVVPNNTVIESPPFAAAGTVLYYSHTDLFGCIDPSFFFAFSGAVLGAIVLNEALVIVTSDGIYVLYGQDESDWLLKKVDDSQAAAAGLYAGAVAAGKLCLLGAERGATGAANGKADGVYVLAGNQIARVSSKVESLFPLSPHTTFSGATLGSFGAGAVENRFCVMQHSTGKLIFDALSGGFLQGDAAGTEFTYRTKEFSALGVTDQFRRCFVIGEGDFTVQVWGDGALLSEEIFSLAAKATEWFYVSPVRCNTFSFRFVGQQNAKIYGYGRVKE